MTSWQDLSPMNVTFKDIIQVLIKNFVHFYPLGLEICMDIHFGPRHDFAWATRVWFREKLLEHKSQTKGFNPVCVRRCLLKVPECVET